MSTSPKIELNSLLAITRIRTRIQAVGEYDVHIEDQDGNLLASCIQRAVPSDGYDIILHFDPSIEWNPEAPGASYLPCFYHIKKEVETVIGRRVDLY